MSEVNPNFSLESLQEAAIELLVSLIKTPSFSGEEDKTASLIEDFLKGYGIASFRENNNVWAFSPKNKKGQKTILLNSHHDTVKSGVSWTKDPFGAQREGDKLFGLGSNDAGASAVSLLASFVYLSGQDLPYNLCVAITGEEENSGKNNVGSILDKLGKIDLGIVGEPTIVVDVRVNENYTNQQVVEQIQNKVDLEVVPRSLRLNSSRINPSHPIVIKAQEMGCKLYGSPTLSDQSVMPFDTVKIGPGDSARSHTPDEYIYLEEIKQGIQKYIELLGDFSF
ncbi:MAG: acetylornithine deacetylase [Flavobacteriaceae bacterium]|nr:MAG: acetylornithine deacetylase [Flavobacteriaceae bacterium]